ncbi:hypothetical protein CWI38_0747p0010 [Hamiltosporidium tvaerminnensis]|uniref:Leucine-rich repeat-containing protein n=1 Tax=Hamiltosporidium tvaerminnensis TaxID=1176355 RepID=A0A4Q9LX80_9MICR|nr:hypothetical protein CWI38_0747p0010 [Hamiltosporidium tvaerminnensis]
MSNMGIFMFYIPSSEAKILCPQVFTNKNFFCVDSLAKYIKIAFLLICLIKCYGCIKVEVIFKDESFSDCMSGRLYFELDKPFLITLNEQNKASLEISEQSHSIPPAEEDASNKPSSKETCYQTHVITGQRSEKKINRDAAIHNVLTEFTEEEAIRPDSIKEPLRFSANSQDAIISSEALSEKSLSKQFQNVSMKVPDALASENDISKKFKDQTVLIDIKCHDAIQESIPTVSFEYTNDFIIRSDYFDKHIDSEETEVKVNIEDITKESVDRKQFCLFLRTCRYALDPKRIGLKKTDVLCFVTLLRDLGCYSTSNILNKLYEHLLPLLLSQKYLISSDFADDIGDNAILNFNKLFLPFINTVFDSIDICFDATKEELVFLKVNTPNKSDLLDFSYLKEIKFRIHADVYSVLHHDGSRPKILTIFWLLWLYTIKGIMVSADNTYFTETKDSDNACELLLKKGIHSDIRRQTDGLFNVFATNQIHLDLKSIELDNIVLSEIDVSYLKKFINLESLILVRCVLPLSSTLLGEIPVYFSKCKELRIICFSLSNIFFQSITNSLIEVLDLSCCEYIDFGEDLDLNGSLNNLKSLKLDYSKLNHQIVTFFLKNRCLRSLSIRNVDFEGFINARNFTGFQKSFDFLDISGCQFSKSYLKFFSTNLFVNTFIMQNSKYFDDLKKILSCKSLHMSVETLDLSGNRITSTMLTQIRKFYGMSNLILSDSSIDFFGNPKDVFLFEDSLKKLNISRSRSGNKFLSILSRFNNLEEFIAPECNFDAGFLVYIKSVDVLKKSLRKIDVARSKVEIMDFFVLSEFENLEDLCITLVSNVFVRYFDNNQLPLCENLKSLTFSFTIVDAFILKLIMLHLNLVNLYFYNCEIKTGSFPRDLRRMLIQLHRIGLIDTNISTVDMENLKYFRRNGIAIYFNQ